MSESTIADSVAAIDNGLTNLDGTWSPSRLNKQYLEGWQILDAIAKTPEGGRQRVNGKMVFAANHPVTNMWRGHEGTLKTYLEECQTRLDALGTSTDKTAARIEITWAENPHWHDNYLFPEWWTDTERAERVLTTHRASLYAKHPVFYRQYAYEAGLVEQDLTSWVCCPGKHQPYYYPTH